jgi:5-formaminoimidazole-4-carboxamide-1-(beta)-D-ribofuranosyl 5'-monophosphate synthetase
MYTIDPAKPITIATLGSHSALDICAGAKKLGFNTLVISIAGREKTYDTYYKTNGDLGCVDEVMIVEHFTDILREGIQKKLVERNAIFIPHRSFEVYLNFDYEGIETKFLCPIFGNKHLLKIEERGVEFNQYDLLQKAGIQFPLQFADPHTIDRLCIVKVLEQERGFERAFFLVDSPSEYMRVTEQKLKEGVFTEKQLEKAVIEEFILGAHVNFNFFYSPISKRLELLGTDTRRQTNLEGFMRTPADYQIELLRKVPVQYEEAGHIAVTVLESLLEPAFSMGERFVTAAAGMVEGGVVGPFALQSIITAGPPKKDIVVIDVSPRMPGSPGIAATPYAGYLYRRPVPVGERVALEIKQAVEQNKLDHIIS